MTVCAFCGETVDPDSPTVWRRVAGWERKGVADSRRGGSDIALRQQMPYWACDGCIRRARAGIAVEQQSLMDEVGS